MKLVPTRNELQVIDFGLLSIRQTTQGIRKSIGKSIRADQKRDSERLQIEKGRMDADKKKRAESLVEAKNPVKFIKGGMKKAVQKAGSVFKGLLTAAGYILMDWLLANLPRILVIIEDVTEFVKSVIKGIETTFENVGNIFKEIGDVARVTWEMFTNFDFSEKKRDELNKEFQDFKGAVEKTGRDFDENYADIEAKMQDLMSQNFAEINKKREELGLEPLTDAQARALAEKSPEIAKLKKEMDEGNLTQEEFDKKVNDYIADILVRENNYSTQEQSAPRAEPQTPIRQLPPSQRTTSNDPQIKRIQGLLKFISSGEGGYNSMNQGTKGNTIVGSTGDSTTIVKKKLTDMTVGEIMKRQAYLMDPSTGDQESDYGLFAVGRYQIIPDTMPTAVRLSGVKMTDRFDQATQDRLGAALLMSKPITRAYLEGRSNDIQGAMQELAAEWASIPNPRTGRSNYGSGNAAGHTVEQLMEALQNARQEYGNQSSITAPVNNNVATLITPPAKSSLTIPVEVPVATINNDVTERSTDSTTVASASASTGSVVSVMQRINRKFT
jgi:hypothetical protein